MGHPCGHPLTGGGTCRHRVADPTKPDCGRHSPGASAARLPRLNKMGCRMQEAPPGVWRCLVHGSDSPEWAVAIALGAPPPCRVPGSQEYKWQLAESETLDPGTAALLAGDPYWGVRRAVAKNPNVPAPVLERLAPDPAWQVRYVVAENLGTSASVLSRLGVDADQNVRRAVARNRNTPGPILERLVTDPVIDVRYRVAGKSGAPGSVLEELASDPEWQVRGAVADNTSTPGPVLKQLASDPDEDVRRKVAKNRSAPGPVLKQLAEDPTATVRQAAIKQLCDRVRLSPPHGHLPITGT